MTQQEFSKHLYPTPPEVHVSPEAAGVKAYALLLTEPYDASAVVEKLNQIAGVRADVCISTLPWNIASEILANTTRELKKIYHETILQMPEVLDHSGLLPVIG